MWQFLTYKIDREGGNKKVTDTSTLPLNAAVGVSNGRIEANKMKTHILLHLYEITCNGIQWAPPYTLSWVNILCPPCRWLSNVCAMWGNLKLTGCGKKFAPPFTATARANIWKKSLPDLIYIICKRLHAQQYSSQCEDELSFTKVQSFFFISYFLLIFIFSVPWKMTSSGMYPNSRRR